MVFYLFAFFLLLGALGVVISRSAVHSVLCLIFTFFNAAGLFLISGAEFLSMLLIVVYVGAVAILWLFVVMMMDTKHKRVQFNSKVGVILAVFIFVEVVVLSFNFDVTSLSPQKAEIFSPTMKDFASVLYSKYLLAFQGSAFILFVAMVAVIALLHDEKKLAKKQSVAKQQRRENNIRLLNPEFGKGVNF